MQRAKELAVMVLARLSQDIPISAPEELLDFAWILLKDTMKDTVKLEWPWVCFYVCN